MSLARHQFTVTNGAGDVIPNATITVHREVAGLPVEPLFSDRAGTIPLGNPFNADADGFAAFHCRGGAFRVTATSDGFERVERFVPVGLSQESDVLTSGISWLFSGDTAATNPGDGFLKFNNATLANVTSVLVNDSSDNMSDVAAWLTSINEYGTALERGILTIQASNASGTFIAHVTGAVTDQGGFRSISVTPLVTSGTFKQPQAVNVSFSASPVNGITPGLLYTFSTLTVESDPGAGMLRFDNASFPSVTEIYISKETGDLGNPDLSAFIESWDDSTNTANRGTLIIKDAAAPENVAIFRITGAAVVSSAFVTHTVAHVASSGSFDNLDTIVIEFYRSADAFTLSAATDSTLGGVELATDGEIRANTTGALAVTAGSIATASAAVALTDAATVAVDWAAGINYTLTVTANRVIGNPTNAQPGTWRTILVQGNDATGRTLTFDTNYLGELPDITDCNSTRWYLLMIYSVSTTHFVVSAKKAMGT